MLGVPFVFLGAVQLYPKKLNKKTLCILAFAVAPKEFLICILTYTKVNLVFEQLKQAVISFFRGVLMYSQILAICRWLLSLTGVPL